MKQKIFIVDDDPDIMDSMTTILTANGYEVASSLTPDDALEKIKKARPSLILLDIMFPEDSSKGFELSRTFHTDPATKDIPVVVLSAVNTRFLVGFSDKEIDEEWMPVREFVEKPIDPDKLLELIKKHAGENVS